EEPFRRGRLWARRPRVVLATALSTAIAVAVFAVGVGDYSLGRVAAVDSAPAAVVEGLPSPQPTAEAVVQAEGSASPTEAASPSAVASVEPEASIDAGPTSSPTPTQPAVVVT